MVLTQVCEGCGELFISRHETFCSDCSVVRIGKIKSPVLIKHHNERNMESKLRDKSKRRRRPTQVEGLA